MAPNPKGIQSNEPQAVTLALTSNRVLLDKLTECYNVFLFTGGTLPHMQWELTVFTPSGGQSVSDAGTSEGDAERYCATARAIMELGRVVAASSPSTLRSRHKVASAFRDLSDSVKRLQPLLEAAATS
jgi:hypothetical protein